MGFACSVHAVGQLGNAELLGELVEHSELALGGGVQDGDLDAPDGVPYVEEASRLAAFAVNRDRMPDRGLCAEAVQHRAPDVVVVEARTELGMQVALGSARPVHDALVEVGCG